MEQEQKLMQRFGLKLAKQVDFYRPGLLDITLTPQQIIHEVAHFQVSSPSRRLVVNFGLGEDSVGSGSLLSKERQVEEETRAFLLTLYWFQTLGVTNAVFGFRFMGEYYKVSPILHEQNRATKNALDWLLEKSLLNQSLRPNYLLNLEEDP